MSFDPFTVLAIVMMGAATYACRAGGYWVFRQIRPSPLLRSILSYVPGTLFVSFVVPAVLSGGWPSLAGAVATLVATLLTRSLPVAILSGVGSAWLVWGMR